MLHSSQFDVICVSETWLNDSIPDHLLTDSSSYSVFRCDRSGSRGGGTMILTKSNLTVSRVVLPHNYVHLELCVVDIALTKISNGTVRLFSCYRPPSSNRDPVAIAYLTELCNCIELLLPQCGSAIITGDFNLPDIVWSPSSAIRCCSYACPGIFLNFVYKHSFNQLVQTPTRLANILDLVLSNDDTLVTNVCVKPSFSTSDHDSVHFNIVYRNRPVNNVLQQRSTKFDFNKADWDSIRLFLAEYDFYELFNSDIITTDKFSTFYAVLHECINLFVPVRATVLATRKRCKYPRHIRKLQSKKLSAWRVYRRSRSATSLSTYKKRASQLRKAVNKHITERENRLIDTGNLGAFYRYANNKLASRSSIGPLSDSDGNLTFDPLRRAELLNETFCKYFTSDNHTLPQLCKHFSSSTQNLSNIIFFSDQR